MPEFESLLWVIPGAIFIYFYNKYTPDKKITVSGWPYLFILVFIAFFTFYIPGLFINKISYLTSCGKEWIETIKIFISMILSFLLFLCCKLERIKHILPKIRDNFYKKCFHWENELVFLTLKNDKTYIGRLWKYPENPQEKYELQTISIVPFVSGYRDEEKKIVWNNFYPEYQISTNEIDKKESTSDMQTEDKKKISLSDMEVIIHRSEILTFGKFNKNVNAHFAKQGKKHQLGK